MNWVKTIAMFLLFFYLFVGGVADLFDYRAYWLVFFINVAAVLSGILMLVSINECFRHRDE